MTTTVQKTIKVATGSKALLGNPFVGDRESIKQAYRKWLWLVHQGKETNEAFLIVEREMGVVTVSYHWRIRSRAKVMKKFGELVRQFQDGFELLTGTEVHAEVILSYIQWRSSNP